ncbi:MAG: hypothetical protein HY791_06370 [Deltaproteobacteria bacterium]|nr:hypothetical protein [Deltaproteobacteria bacterium]
MMKSWREIAVPHPDGSFLQSEFAADITAVKDGSATLEYRDASAFFERVKAYPIRPEVFDRLYEGWSTLESFQRARGVLKLMAHVIHDLWAKGSTDLLILPASLPLNRGKARDELLSHLPPGWDAVLDKDIDDEHAEAVDLDNKEGRFGAVQTARRVARVRMRRSLGSRVGVGVGARGEVRCALSNDVSSQRDRKRKPLFLPRHAPSWRPSASHSADGPPRGLV